ncbi:MAG: tetratricopeptide repeat protein [Myxococcales bacterium]
MRSLGLLVAAWAVFAAAPARAAEPSDPAAAEALFADGKALMQQGDYERACPKLEESYRLDPATGALLALGLCHEGQGKLASAWAELMNVAALASAEHNPEREQAARQRAESLAPRLAFLIVQVQPSVARLPDLAIQHDGVQLRPAAWGAQIPVDPGRHLLRASAKGREPWEAEILIVRPGQRAVVQIPELVPPGPAKPSPSERRPRTTPSPITPVRLAGVALGSAGATSLLFAAGALWRALSQDAAADDNCRPAPCNASAERQRASATEAGRFATIASIGGGALLGTGIVLFVVGRPSPNQTTTVRWAAGLTSHGIELRRDF